MKLTPITFIFLIATCFSRLAAGAALFNNGVPLSNVLGWDATGFIEADNFTLASQASLSSATIYLYDDPGPWDGSLEYFFYADEADRPGDLLASGVGQAVLATPSGVTHANGEPIQKVLFTFQMPFNASDSTTYWFGLHLKQDYIRTDTRWAASSETGNNWFQENGTGTWDQQPDSVELSFQLQGTAVPEPSSAIVLLSGSFLLIRRRKLRTE